MNAASSALLLCCMMISVAALRLISPWRLHQQPLRGVPVMDPVTLLQRKLSYNTMQETPV